MYYHDGVTWKYAGKVGANVLSKEISVSGNGRYEILIRSYNSLGEASSEKFVLNAMVSAVTAPGNMNAVWSSGTTILATWDDAENEDGYYVYYHDGVTWKYAGKVGANVLSKEITVSGNGRYEILIRSYNSHGEASSEKFVLNAMVSAVTAPGNVSASWSSGTTILATWDDAENEDGYYVYYHDGVTWKYAGKVEVDGLFGQSKSCS